MTVAQLVHPARGLVRHTHRPLFRAPRRAAYPRWACDAALWRAIVTGLGLALIGLVMLVLAIAGAGVAPSAAGAIGAAGVAPPVAGLRSDMPGSDTPVGDASVAARAMPNHRLKIYQDPAEALTWAMPVP